MIPKVEIFDDILPKKYVDQIDNLLTGLSFPWFFVKDVTYPTIDSIEELKDCARVPGHHHTVFEQGQVMSQYYDFFSVMPMMFLDKIGEDRDYVLHRIKSFLYLPNPNVVGPHNKHIDAPFEHKVLLYYVNDSDGDTILYGTNEQDETITHTIKPKKGRIAYFDGNIFHSSSSPTKTERVIVNYNLIF